VLRAPDARVVATMDVLVEGRHFRRDWSAAFDIGCTAAARNMADIAAMGACPTALLVGLATPGDLPVEWARELTRGLAAESARAGASVAGGDISSAATIMIAVTALGDLQGRDPVTRGGARPGDLVAVAGRLGRSAAGLALLTAGLAGPAGAGPAGEMLAGTGQAGLAGAGDLAGPVAAYQRPEPPYAAGPEAAALGATAMIDISDGLVQDLGHVAAASGTVIDIAAGQLPGDPQLRAAAAALGGADWLSWMLTGGEDHALAATFPPGTRLPDHWPVIGTVYGLTGHAAAGRSSDSGRDQAGPTVLVDGRQPAGPGGWDHFR
jgi:thiamine-monophosphate kinase